MRTLLIAIALLTYQSQLLAQSRTYRIEVDPRSNPDGSRDIEMRDRYNSGSSSRFRGEIESDGSVRMRNSQGDRLRGEIDSDGYGRLRDQDGNVYRVKPR
jgi:hypothetical protein